jgi:hypothetical protein
MAEVCAEIGIEVVLLSPSIENLDWGVDGPWQRIMFVGMGLEVGRGEWEPGHEPPASVELLDQVRRRGMAPVAYSNPQNVWQRHREWTVVRPEDVGDYRWACLAVPAAQDAVIDTMRAFREAYDLGGFSLDFVFWGTCHSPDHGHAVDEGSMYAQWDGYRRILAVLSEGGQWVETLIGSQLLLPWGALDMTHPHPVLGDNQPQWVPAWPDLSVDRANGNFQRRTAFWMRNFAFTPSYKIPGQVGHQANRVVQVEVERGWDWEGARFNLLSAVATGPSSLSVCFLPAWDEAEWSGMRARDGAFFARWIAFVKEHAEVLSRLEDLFDEPQPGAVDGTIALDDDGLGFAFLANPDHTPLAAVVPLAEGRALRELHPEEGRLWDGEVVVDPHEVAVLEVIDSPGLALPAVFGVAGSVDGDGRLVTATGTPGSTVAATVRRADGSSSPVQLTFADDGVQPTLGPWFSPPLRSSPPHVADYSEVDAAWSAPLEELEGTATIVTEWAPGAALPGLLAELAPPIAPVGDEHLHPWSDPSRLRLFVDLLDPQAVTVRVRVDGDDVEVRQAWIGTFEHVKDPDRARIENNLLGHYVDLTDRLAATDDLDRAWTIELTVDGLWRGQLRGVHVAHLPRRRTSSWSPA